MTSAVSGSVVGLGGLLLLAGCQAPCPCSSEHAVTETVTVSRPELHPSFTMPAENVIPDSSTGSRYVGYLEGFGPGGTTTIGREPADTSLAQVSFASEGADFDPVIDADGTWMVYASTQHAETADIYRKKIGGRTLVRLTADPAEDAMPVISPDGRWIAFASNRSGNWDIWMMPAEGGVATQLTSQADDELHPSFSPDGSKVAYCRQNKHSARWEIWTFALDQPGTRTFVCDGLFPQWSPEENRDTLLFQRARDRGSRFYGIWTVDFVAGQAMNPTEIVAASDAAIMHPSWSPDGRSICFCSVLRPEGTTAWSERSDIWVIGADGTGRTALTEGRFRNMQPTWSREGRIYFVSNRGGLDCIWSVNGGSAGVRFETGTLASVEDDASE